MAAFDIPGATVAGCRREGSVYVVTLDLDRREERGLDTTDPEVVRRLDEAIAEMVA